MWGHADDNSAPHGHRLREGGQEMTRMPRLSVVLVATLALVATSQAQFVVYSQPNDNPNGFCSSGIPGQYCQMRMADNFLLGNAYYREISEITWWGSSDNYSDPDLTNFTHWQIVVYRASDSLPGDVVYEELIAKEDIVHVETGNQNSDGGWEYMHTATLAGPPTLYIDEPYWISIGYVAYDPGGDGWIWSVNYFEGDDYSAGDYFDGQGYESHSGDLAFVLIGDPASGCPRAGASGKGCTADIDGSNDCKIGLPDLAEMLRVYGTCPGDPEYNPEANVSEDGDPCINLADLGELLSQYGDDCSL
jgi:hypothetical protein